MRTFKKVELIITDSRGERYPLTLDEQQLDARGILDEVSRFLASCTTADDWARQDTSDATSDDSSAKAGEA